MTKFQHFYKNIQGWPNELPQLYARMVTKFSDNSHFVEIGAWKGASTVSMAVEIANSGKNIRFDVVDTWQGSKEHQTDKSVIDDTLFQEFLNNISPVKDYINVVKSTSIDAANLYDDNSLDFVCIDASHDYEQVKQDILIWLPKIKPAGVLAGDDFHFTWPGVIRAVQELLPGYQYSVSSWWWNKSY